MNLSAAMELKDNWQLMLIDDCELTEEICTGVDFGKYSDRIIPARVPGDWPLDYVRQGLLDDPFFGGNFRQLLKYETMHVYYLTRFYWEEEPDDRTYLCFEGIDTVADIYLNGTRAGHAENMFIPHEFSARGLIRGENELLVHILPATLEARKYAIAAHNTTQKYNYEALVIRKAIHCFGWDICPRIVSAGLWRPVWIYRRKAERIENVFIWLEKLEDDGSAQMQAVYDVDIGREPVHDYELQLEGVCGESRFCIREKLWFIHGHLHFRIKKPRLWWVRGYGDPSQYEVKASLFRNGTVIDERCWKQGFRSVRLLHDNVITGGREAEFCFVLNGKRIFIKGTNWVPADAFHSNDMNRIPAILDLVWDIGCNAIRIWGGGVYENDYVYDWCDEKGILIWQDFMMACGVYPKTDRMIGQMKEEVTAVVRRLRHHPSICLWAGDNECDFVGYEQTGGYIDPSDNELTRVIIPRILSDEDLSRPYLPSSPYISHEAYLKGQIQETPEQHLWGPRDYYKSGFYHDHSATFASEMGYHGCNSPSSVRRFIPEDRLWPVKDNDMWTYHAASPEIENAIYHFRIPLMSVQISCLFRQKPEDLSEYARMSQAVQAEADKYFVESFRSHKGLRTGLIWWNIMDNWPQFSDAVADYYFCKKLAYHFIRRSQQPLCLMMDDKDGPLVLYAVNDTAAEYELCYSVRDLDTDNQVTGGRQMIKADASTALQVIDDDLKQHFYVIEWETADGEKGLNHYLQGTPLFDFHWYLGCLRKLGLDEFDGFEDGKN